MSHLIQWSQSMYNGGIEDYLRPSEHIGVDWINLVLTMTAKTNSNPGTEGQLMQFSRIDMFPQPFPYFLGDHL